MGRAVVFELPGFKTPLNTQTLWAFLLADFFLSVTRVEPRQASHFIYRSQTSPGFTMLSGRVQGTYCLVRCIFELCMWSAVLLFINIVAIIMTSQALHLALFSSSIGALFHSAGGSVYGLRT